MWKELRDIKPNGLIHKINVCDLNNGFYVLKISLSSSKIGIISIHEI